MEAKSRGFHTIAITDHSRSSVQANGLSPERLLQHIDAVREVTPQDGGQGIVTLADGTKLEVSRRRFAELTSRLAGST